MVSPNYAAVVTTPFLPSRGRRASLELALKELLRLQAKGVRHVYVLLDRRSERGQPRKRQSRQCSPSSLRLGSAWNSLSSPKPRPPSGGKSGSSRAWPRGLTPSSSSPATWRPSHAQANRAGWADMLDAVSQEAGESPGLLVVGDYRSQDAFTENFDQDYLLPLIGAVHGAEAREWAASLGITKLRSEFLVVSSTLYRELGAEGIATWSADPTPQLLLFVHRHVNTCRVRRIAIGPFGDNDDTRKPVGCWHQMVRVFAAQANDRLHAALKSPGPAVDDSTRIARELTVCEKLIPILDDAWQTTVRAGKQNLARLRGPLVQSATGGECTGHGQPRRHVCHQLRRRLVAGIPRRDESRRPAAGRTSGEFPGRSRRERLGDR